MLCDGGVLADIFFHHGVGQCALYSGEQVNMTRKHAVGPSTRESGPSFSVIVDSWGDDAACKVVEERTLAATARLASSTRL